MSTDNPTPARVAEPMSEERIARLRQYMSQITTDDALDAFVEIERLVSIIFMLNTSLESTRTDNRLLRAIAAERDGEIRRLKSAMQTALRQIERDSEDWRAPGLEQVYKTLDAFVGVRLPE